MFRRIYPFLDPKRLIKLMISQNRFGKIEVNGKQELNVPYNLLFFLPETPPKTDDFMEHFLNSVFFVKITFKTIDFSDFFLVERVDRSIGSFRIPKKYKNSTRMYHFDSQFEGPILVTVYFK